MTKENEITSSYLNGFQPEEKPPKKRKLLKFLLHVLFVLVLVAGSMFGTYYFMNYILPTEETVSTSNSDSSNYFEFIALQVKSGKININDVSDFFYSK